MLLTPALRVLKQAYPESYVTLWLRPHVADLMKTHPYIDASLVDTKSKHGRAQRSFFSINRLAKQVREQMFDLAVVLHPTSLRNALVPFLARVPIRIGTQVNCRGILLTASCVDNTDVHEVYRYLRVIQLLGINTAPVRAVSNLESKPIAPRLQFWHTEADKQSIQRLLQAEGVSSSQQLVGINLGTTWRTKRWPVENFATVIQQIARLEPQAKIVLTGASGEREIAETLHRLCYQDDSLSIKRTYPRLVNLVGKTTILQLGALVERLTVYLTCDSGPMHIAAAVGTPTVSLFGPTTPTRHKPFGSCHTVLEKPISCRPCYKRTCHRQNSPHLCMTSITTKDVLEALQKNR